MASGRAHALELARLGARVVVNDLGATVHGTDPAEAAADQVVAEIRAGGGQAVPNFDTVATPEGGAAIVATAMAAYGRVDIVINNAGILRDKAFHHMDADMIHAVIDIHLKGALFVTQPAFRIGCGNRGTDGSSAPPSASGFVRQLRSGQLRGRQGGPRRADPSAGNRGRPPQHPGQRDRAAGPHPHDRRAARRLGHKVGPETVTPVVAYLASQQCSVTGEIFSVAGGRVARIFFAETPGYILPDLSAEAVRDGLMLINDNDGFHTPSSLDDARAIIDNALLAAAVPMHAQPPPP